MAPGRDRKEAARQEGCARGRQRKDVHGGERRQRRAAVADSATQEDHCHPRKVFIGGLPSNTTTQDLRSHFSRFGAVADAVVLQWPDGRSRGFGYVTYAEASATMAALCTQHVIGGRPVDVKRAVPGTNKLFVGGLPQNVTAAELREHFEAYGVVSDAVVMIDPSTSRSRGFGFVCFCPGQEGAAALGMALEQYQSHRIRGKWIEVKSAAPPHKLGQEATSSAAPEVAGALPLLMGAQPPPWLCPAATALALQQGCPEGLPQLLSRAEPQKVALPAKAPELLGTPPGLEGVDGCTPPGLEGVDGMHTPRMAWDPSGGGMGVVPWPCAHGLEGVDGMHTPRMAWDPSGGGMGVVPWPCAHAGAPWALQSLGPDLHDPQAPGEWSCPTAKPPVGAAGTPAFGEGLQRSLEQLLKLRLGEAEEAGPAGA